MNFQWAWAHSGTIYLKYKDLSDKCRAKGEDANRVIIKCKGYRNPISPAKMDDPSVTITTFDNEKRQRPIAILTGKFTASDFKAALIPNADLEVVSQPTPFKPFKAGSNTEREETAIDSHKVSLYLPVPIPMEQGCTIKVELPGFTKLLRDPNADVGAVEHADDFLEVTGHGIFKTAAGNTFKVVPEADGRSFTIDGCTSFDGIGAEPFGRLAINHVELLDNAENSGDHIIVRIFNKGTDKLIALLDGGSASDLVDKFKGTTTDSSLF